MLVDIIQWRAAIGIFRSSLGCYRKVVKKMNPFKIVSLVLKMYLFCCIFIAISIPLLPLTMVIQVIIQFPCYPHPTSCFLPLFTQLYCYSKLMLYTLLELTKRLPLLFRSLFQHKRCVMKLVFLGYGHLYLICLIFDTLWMQWTIYKSILLSGDIETNPGPDKATFSFCSWNLNSICAHDFTRVSLIEAYNSVHSYDLIGIVETHLDSTTDESKLTLDGYSFFKNNHPQNIERGGVGLYYKESFPAKQRHDLETLPECIVCEFQLNRKKYFFTVLYRSPSQNQEQFQAFTDGFELIISKMAAENPYCVIVTGDFNCRSPQ